MNKSLIALAISSAAITTSAQAGNLSDIAQFAQSICGDIPQGNLTRTSIQGKIGANAGLLARIVSGNADVSGSRTTEIYNGVPFDKLPDKIPTVAMCKTQVVQIILFSQQNQISNAPGGIIQNGGTDNKGTVINNK